MKSSIWIERFRPEKLSEIIGQDEIVKRIKAMIENKNLGNLLLAGPPGVGKTSLILAAVKELYGEDWRNNIMETNASMDRGIQIVREEIKNFARTKAIGNVPFKICILDESDALTRDAQQALRRTMEIYSNTCRFCLIANYSSKIIEPIQSRCMVFRFKPIEKKDILKIIIKIASLENLKINEGATKILYEVSEGDIRKLQNILQASASLNNEITEDTIYQVISLIKPKEIKQILELALNKRFIESRNLLLNIMLNNGLSGIDIIKQILRELNNLEIPDEKKLELIDKCGEIEFRITEGADEFIQMECLLANFAK